jgi:hypothetical protein
MKPVGWKELQICVPAAAASEGAAAALWNASGASELTAGGAAIPERLVARVVGLPTMFDDRGAGLADLVPEGTQVWLSIAAYGGSSPHDARSVGSRHSQRESER